MLPSFNFGIITARTWISSERRSKDAEDICRLYGGFFSLSQSSAGGIPHPRQNTPTTNQLDNKDKAAPLSSLLEEIDSFITGYKDEIVAVSTALLAVITLGAQDRSNWELSERAIGLKIIYVFW